MPLSTLNCEHPFSGYFVLTSACASRSPKIRIPGPPFITTDQRSGVWPWIAIFSSSPGYPEVILTRDTWRVLAGSFPRVSALLGLGWRLTLCFYNSCPGTVHSACWGALFDHAGLMQRMKNEETEQSDKNRRISVRKLTASFFSKASKVLFCSDQTF